MNILAIETAGSVASAAVMDGEGRIHCAFFRNGQSHLQRLMPLVSEALRDAGVKKEQLELVAVSAGPGSFTGIRIGLAAARTLAQALDIRLVQVSTLYSCAFTPGLCGVICPMIDARHGNVYAASYYRESEHSEPVCLIEPGIYAADDFRGSAGIKASERGLPPLFRGDGAGTEEFQSAELVVLAGRELFLAGKAGDNGDYRAASPEYLQKSEAERKLKSGITPGRRLLSKKNDKTGTAVELPPEDEKVTYRRIFSSETAKLASLDAECFSSCWTKSDFDGEFTAAGGKADCVYVAAENSKGELIGFAGLVCLFGQGDINRVAVSPLYRMRGIGTELVNALEREAEKIEATNLMLEVRESNRSGIALYKNCGFKVINRRKHYYSDNGDNALVMRKELES